MRHDFPDAGPCSARIAEIPGRISSLNSEIVEIQNTLEVLTARMASVTGAEKPTNQPERGVPSSNTEIGEQITLAAYRCGLINDRLRELIDRLEV